MTRDEAITTVEATAKSVIRTYKHGTYEQRDGEPERLDVIGLVVERGSVDAFKFMEALRVLGGGK